MVSGLGLSVFADLNFTQASGWLSRCPLLRIPSGPKYSNNAASAPQSGVNMSWGTRIPSIWVPA